jgi:hypothetical protein
MMQNIGSPLDLARRLKDICFFAQFSGCRRRDAARPSERVIKNFEASAPRAAAAIMNI